MAYRVELSPTAFADIEAILLGIRQYQSLEKANQWFAGCYEAILSLEQFPERCPRAPEDDYIKKTIRQRLYKHREVYRILFTVQSSRDGEGLVQIHRVLHSAQKRLRTESELLGEP